MRGEEGRRGGEEGRGGGEEGGEGGGERKMERRVCVRERVSNPKANQNKYKRERERERLHTPQTTPGQPHTTEQNYAVIMYLNNDP